MKPAELEQATLQRFRQLYEEPTYKQMSAISGIQVTRMFRLCQGAPMRVAEFVRLEELIDERLGDHALIDKALKRCKEVLSIQELGKIAAVMNRKYEVAKLIKR